MARATRNYINNPEFLECIVEYKNKCKDAEESGDDQPPIPNYIGECIYKIATRLATKPNFSGYTYKDEMISDGLENAIQALGNFDPEKSSNPFAYFTQIIWYAFLRRIEKEKKQLYIKHKVVENSVIHGTATSKDSPDVEGDAEYIDLNNDYMTDFVRTYEAKMDEKKQTQRIKSKKGLEKFIPEDEIDQDKSEKDSDSE
jgi:DNA-directed RNA polymerase specialized sigma24 family protein